MLNMEKINQDFPMLKTHNQGKQLVYLDTAATSLKPQAVIDIMNNYYQNIGATVHRGVYELSYNATVLYDLTRTKVAKFINAKQDNEIVFTKNATDGLNLVAHSFGNMMIKSGDEIIVSEFAHHANYLPWMQLAEQKGAKLVVVRATGQEITVESIKSAITSKTKIIAIHHVSNVMGDIIDISKVCQIARENNIYTVIDGAQAVPHLQVDVQALGCDFYIFTGHKMLAPTGVGILYGKYDLLDQMPPITFGGDMIDVVGSNGRPSTWKKPPIKFEAGTPAIAEVIGLGAAIDYLQQFTMTEIHQHELHLKQLTIKKMKELGTIDIYNDQTPAGIISFNVKGIPMHDVASYLDKAGIAVRAGHHCSQPTMWSLGVNSTLRVSFYIYNTEKDVETLIEALKNISQKEDTFLDVLFG